ncbi:MAG: response regulator [Bacteroidota bacterium]
MSKRGKILIVEDSLITSIHLEKLVLSAGFEIFGKTDFAEQVQPLCSHEQPDLILMDIMLNGEMSGVDAAEQLRLLNQDMPIVFVSALSDSETQSRISGIANSTIVPKPFDHTLLVSTIGNYLN